MKYHFIKEVSSKTNPTKKYTVKMNEHGLLTCNCPSWIYNQRGNRTCKHIDEIINAGFVADATGKFIVGTTKWGGRVTIYCKNYPEKCGECSLRFLCYTEKSPEFTKQQLIDAGIEDRKW